MTTRWTTGIVVLAAFVCISVPAAACSCDGDFDDDDAVGTTDLLALLGAWGTSDPIFDLNGSGQVETGDLLDLLAGWGPCLFVDLRLDIVNEPNSAPIPSMVQWTVRISNEGTISSLPGCVTTGIAQGSGPGNWSGSLGILDEPIPSIAADEDCDVHILYLIPPNAQPFPQWIKAEFTLVGCPDPCPAGNYRQEPITLFYP